MKYFNYVNLLALLGTNSIVIYLLKKMSDKEVQLSALIVMFLLFSLLLWVIVSVIFSAKKSVLKKSIFYFAGIGLWGSLVVVDNNTIQLLGADSGIFIYLPYLLVIVLCFLPIKSLWDKKKEKTI